MIKISDFQTKDVVNVIDGRKLGQVSDLELDLKSGRIDAIVVPGPGKFFGLMGGGQELIIPWKHIVKIGLDVVLVKLEDNRHYFQGNDGYSSTEEMYRPASYK
ncbi:MAG: YlmC/YmxH family sporulation protein [Bacilli bacterium]